MVSLVNKRPPRRGRPDVCQDQGASRRDDERRKGPDQPPPGQPGAGRASSGPSAGRAPRRRRRRLNGGQTRGSTPDPRAQPYDNVIQNPKREGMVSSSNNCRSGDGLVRGGVGRRRRARPLCPCGDTGCCQKSSCHDMGILWSGGAVYDPAGLLTDFLFCRFRFPHWVTLLREARPRKWAPGGSSRGARRRTDSPPSSGVDPLVEQNTPQL